MISLHDLLIALLTSGATVTALAFVLKRLVDRSIDHRFRLKELAEESELKRLSEARTALFDKELMVYPEIMEVVYRSRNAARECADGSTRTRSALHDFQACKIHLTENLFKYRIFIPDSEFRSLHRLKTQLQEFGVLLDEVTRSTLVEDSPVDPQLQELANRQLAERFATIDRSYASLIPKLQLAIRGKTHPH